MQAIPLLEKQTERWDQTGMSYWRWGIVTAYERKQEEARGGQESYPIMMHVQIEHRLYIVVQCKEILAKLIGESSSQNHHQSNPTSCKNRPALVPQLHSVICGDKLLERVASAPKSRWTECSIWSQQSITLPKIGNVRGRVHDCHNAFVSYCVFMRQTMLIKV